MKRLLLMLIPLVLLVQPALAVEVAGLNLPDRVEIAGQSLQLNGYGIRKKFFFKI